MKTTALSLYAPSRTIWGAANAEKAQQWEEKAQGNTHTNEKKTNRQRTTEPTSATNAVPPFSFIVIIVS